MCLLSKQKQKEFSRKQVTQMYPTYTNEQQSLSWTFGSFHTVPLVQTQWSLRAMELIWVWIQNQVAKSWGKKRISTDPTFTNTPFHWGTDFKFPTTFVSLCTVPSSSAIYINWLMDHQVHTSFSCADTMKSKRMQLFQVKIHNQAAKKQIEEISVTSTKTFVLTCNNWPPIGPRSMYNRPLLVQTQLP